MTESIAILFVFFILLIFGFVFYTNVMRSTSHVEQEENIQLKAIGIAQKTSFLPELQCSKENIRTENCIDLLKLDAASDLIEENNIYYYDTFEFSHIRVKEISPGTKEWTLYNNTPSNYSDRLSTFIPISLFNASVSQIRSSGQYDFGILIVDVYRK